MTIQWQNLGVSYLDDAQLPQILRRVTSHPNCAFGDGKTT